MDRSGVGSPPVRLGRVVASRARIALFDGGRADGGGTSRFMQRSFFEPRRSFHAIRHVGFAGGYEQPLCQTIAL